MFEPAGAGVGELTPWADGEGEARATDEVISVEAVFGGHGAEEDQEVLGVVCVHREVAVLELEGGVEQVGHLVDGDAWARADDGGHHRAGCLGFLYLNGARQDDARRLGSVRSNHRRCRRRRKQWWRRWWVDDLVGRGRRLRRWFELAWGGVLVQHVAGVGVVTRDEAAAAPDVVGAAAHPVTVVEAAEAEACEGRRRGAAQLSRRWARPDRAARAPALASGFLESVGVDQGPAWDMVDL